MALLALLAATVPTQMAGACTIAISADVLTKKTKKSAEEKAEEAEMRKRCKAAKRDRLGFLASVTAGTIGPADFQDLLFAFRSGLNGCKQDIAFAFEIRNASVPDPIPMDGPRYALDELFFLSRDSKQNPNSPRIKEIAAAHWLLSGSSQPVPSGWQQKTLRQYLFAPQRWARAVQLYGSFNERNPERDRLVLEAAMDPRGPKFDPGLALKLSPTLDNRIKLAAIFTDPALGTPDYESAMRLLAVDSPYYHDEETRELRQRREPIWNRIATRFIASGDAATREKGLAMLSGADPYAPPPVKPDIAALVELPAWPSNLPQIDVARLFTSDDYPSRAMREEGVGTVHVAVLFGPDGAYSKLWVSRSSGNIDLDEKTTTLILRRARPHIDKMRLEGYAGRSVLAPFAVIEWHLSESEALRPAGVMATAGRVAVTATMPQWVRYDGPPCGSSYSPG